MAKNVSQPSIFRAVFEGVAGGFAVIILIGLICVVLFGTGWYLIVKYNKKGTKYFKEIQPMQYVGIVLCVLACLPFIQYFFFGFLSSAGGAVFDNMFE
jgi:heme/copper-type cytochrome/quinol oxidase subunit 2